MKKQLHTTLKNLFKLAFFILVLSISTQSKAQFQTGTYPDFTLTTFGTNDTFHLYSYLDAGKMVVIDFFEYECGPCWPYHSTHTLSTFYDLHGPNGDNTAMVVQICTFDDADSAKLTWDNGQTINWLAGVTYPTIILPKSKYYAVFGFMNSGTPAIPRICPNYIYTKEHPTPSGSASNISANYTLAGLENWLHTECGVYAGIETLISKSDISVYPNPVAQSMTIKGLENVNYNFKLINIVGQTVIDIQNNTFNTIDVSYLAEGIYFASFEINNHIITKKLFIKH